MVGKSYNGGGTLTDTRGQLIGEKSEPYVEKNDSLVVRELSLLIAAYRLVQRHRKGVFRGFVPNLSKPLGPLEKHIRLKGGLKEWVISHQALPILQKRLTAKARRKSGIAPFDEYILLEANQIEDEINKSLGL